MQEGIVAGGGSALLFATRALDKVKGANEDQTAGINIVRKVLQSPIRQIAENAGFDGAVVANEVLSKNDATYGFDAQTSTAQNPKYVDMFKAGIVDPTKIVRSALEGAASVAGLLITTEAAIVDKKEDNAGGGNPMGGMGGMGGY